MSFEKVRYTTKTDYCNWNEDERFPVNESFLTAINYGYIKQIINSRIIINAGYDCREK